MVPHCSHDVHICMFTCMTEWQCHVTTDPERNQNITVVVSNQSFQATVAAPLKQPDYIFCAQYNGIPPVSSKLKFTCSGGPITGRYVYVYLPGLSKPLTLCEVEVIAQGKLRDMRLFQIDLKLARQDIFINVITAIRVIVLSLGNLIGFVVNNPPGGPVKLNDNWLILPREFKISSCCRFLWTGDSLFTYSAWIIYQMHNKVQNKIYHLFPNLIRKMLIQKWSQGTNRCER